MLGHLQTEETRKKISATCKERGIGKWMLGKKQSEETSEKKRIKQKLLVDKGTHNFWKGGRKQKLCLDCNDPITYYRTKCVKCAPAKKENHWNWKGGITAPNKAARTSIEYNLWQKAVFTRDNYTCVWCKKHGGTLHADHILEFATHPELRFAIDNGRTLCKPCHYKRHYNKSLQWPQ